MHQHVFVLDHDGRLLLRLPGDVYPPEEMNQLVVALDVPVTDFPDIVTRPQPGQVPVLEPGFVKLTEFDEEHPGLLSTRDFKPYGDSRVLTVVVAIMAVLVVAILVVAVIVLIFFGPHDRIR